MSNEFTKKYFQPCVEKFVSTVLLIDDQLEYGKSPTLPSVENEALIVPTQGTVMPNVESETLFFSSTSDDGKRKVYVTDLIKTFSKEKLLVTPINPNEIGAKDKDECMEILTGLAEKTDVIILDWDMYVKFSETDFFSSNELSKKLIEKLNLDNKYRLVMIYTADSESEVKKNLPQTTNIDVKIYGKNNSTGTIEKKYEELVKQINIDFLSSKKGLLTLLLLKVITHIRYSTYSMLDTLRSDFDKSALCHYLLTNTPADFQDFCEDIIYDEIFGYLEQCNASDILKNEVIKYVIDENEISYESEQTEKKDSAELIKYIDFLENKADDSIKKSMKNFLTKKLSGVEITMLKQFSIFVSTLDKSLVQNLHLGCVVKKDDNYYLCIQPACDSIRVPSKELIETKFDENSNKKQPIPKSFVFLKLEKSEDKVDFYIQNSSEIIGLSIIYNQVENFYFSGDKDGLVSLTQEGSFKTYSIKDENITFDFVCCLKTMFAQKIANNFAANISRVGIDQFEWLRLKGRE